MTEEAPATVTETTASESTTETTAAETTAATTATTTEPKPFDVTAYESQWGDYIKAIEEADVKEHGQRFKHPREVVKGNLDQRKAMSGMVKVPGKDPTPDEISAFRKAIQAGEKPEDYKVGAPDGYQMGQVQNALVGVMQERAVASGIPKAAFEEFTKAYFETEVAVQKKVEQEVRDFRIESESKLRAEHGKDYDRRLRAGNALIDKLDATGEVRQLLDDNIQWKGASIKLGDHPAILKVMSELGLRMGEDSVLAVNSADEAKSLDTQIAELERKYPIGRRTREQDQKIQALYKQRYPS